MSAAYDGRQVVGLDLHRRRTVMVRMTPEGERLEAVRFASDPAVLAGQIGKTGPAPRVVYEATYGWYWAADVLAAVGAEPHMAHPLGVEGFAYRRVKNDVRDAADISPTCCEWVGCRKRGSLHRRCVSSGSWCGTGTSCARHVGR